MYTLRLNILPNQFFAVLAIVSVPKPPLIRRLCNHFFTSSLFRFTLDELRKSGTARCLYDYRPNWTPLGSISIINPRTENRSQNLFSFF